MCLIVVNIDKPQVVQMVLALLVFAIRDIALLHYFVLSPNNRRATGAIFFYLAVLYILMPMLLYATNMKEAAPLFLPLAEPNNGGPLLAVISGVLQALFCINLVRKRWKKYWQ